MQGDPETPMYVTSKAAAVSTATKTTWTTGAAQTVLPLNPARRGATIQNDSGQPVFVKFGAGASAADYSLQMATGTRYDLPAGYTGPVSVFSSIAGLAADLIVTEFTA